MEGFAMPDYNDDKDAKVKITHVCLEGQEHSEWITGKIAVNVSVEKAIEILKNTYKHQKIENR